MVFWLHKAYMKKKNETRIIKMLIRVLGFLPKSISVMLGKFLAAVWFMLDGKHRAKILTDINRTSLRELSEEEKKKLVRGVYRHYGIMAAEISKFRRWSAEKVRACISFDERTNLKQELEKGKGVILIGAHLGNWELTGMALPLFDIPICAVARPLKNEDLNAFLSKSRTRFGQVTLSKFNVMLEIIRKLRAGNAIGLLIDQDAEKDSEYVPFMDEIAGTLRIPAKLAVKYKLPVFCLSSYRIRPFEHKYRIIGPIEYPVDSADPIKDTTEIFNNAMSSVIYENPSQWMWFHHRWRSADKLGLTRLSGKNNDSKQSECESRG